MPAKAKTRQRRRILGLDPEQRQTERRRLVLDSALELFATNGFARTTIEALCKHAGVGTNSFYEIFDSKEDVLAALYLQVTDAMRNAVAEAYLHHRDDPDPALPMVAAFVHAVVDDPRVARVAFFEAMGVGDQVEVQRRHARTEFAAGLEAIGRDLRNIALGSAAVDVSERPGPSPRRNAVALVGAIIEMTTDWLQDADHDPVEQLIADIAHHCNWMLGQIVDEMKAADTA